MYVNDALVIRHVPLGCSNNKNRDLYTYIRSNVFKIFSFFIHEFFLEGQNIKVYLKYHYL